MIKRALSFFTVSIMMLLGLAPIDFGPVNVFSQNTSPGLGAKSFSSSERAAAVAYWTPERLQSAIPMDVPLADKGAAPQNSRPATKSSEPAAYLPGQPPTSKDAKPSSGPGPLPSGNNKASGTGIEPLGFTYPYPFTRFSVLSLLYDETIPPVYPYTTIGKLFFTLGGQNFVCSASVVRPHLVLTARHCIFNYIHPSGGQFAENVVFFPGWHSGPNFSLGGGWPARILATWVANAPDFAFDIGFIQLFDDTQTGCGGSDGFPIEAYTGHLGATWGGSYEQRQWNQFGYPQGAPFNGTIMIESQSATGALNQFGQVDTVEVGSDQTGGSSGGPWIIGFDPLLASVPPANPGGNFANGVNSFKFVARPQAMNSPQFHDYNFNQLRLFAEGLPCP